MWSSALHREVEIEFQQPPPLWIEIHPSSGEKTFLIELDLYLQCPPEVGLHPSPHRPREIKPPPQWMNYFICSCPIPRIETPAPFWREILPIWIKSLNLQLFPFPPPSGLNPPGEKSPTSGLKFLLGAARTGPLRFRLAPLHQCDEASPREK